MQGNTVRTSAHQMPPFRKHSTTVSVATGSATFPRTLNSGRTRAKSSRSFPQESSHVASSPLFHQFVEAVNVARGIVSAGRVFGVTDEGHMGLFLPSSQEGDSICLFHGSACPFNLRIVDHLLVEPG
jgi:hypothetical protein